MRPDRLIREARRTAERLWVVALAEAVGAGLAFAKWLGDKGSFELIAAALAAVLAVPVTMIVRQRQLRRAHWLESTENWHECLDLMPRMEPFPRLVDFVESRVLFRSRRVRSGGDEVDAD